MTEHKRHILFVDDEEDIIKVLSRRLEIAGYTVSMAEDGEAALAKVRETRPDLIILDVMIPKLNGYEVCARLKQDDAYKKIPIIMFTAKGQTQEHLAGLMFGADAYISKACEFKVLLDQVEALLSKQPTS